jgi:DNA-binding MarR family transcriptional regulator
MPVGISLAQLSLMRNIARPGIVSVGELARLMELDRSTTGRNVRVLVKAGMVSFAASDDHRETIVVISDEGSRTLQEAAPLWESAQRKVEARLGLDNAEILLDMVEQL